LTKRQTYLLRKQLSNQASKLYVVNLSLLKINNNSKILWFLIAQTYAQDLNSKTCTGEGNPLMECPGITTSPNLQAAGVGFQSMCVNGVCACDKEMGLEPTAYTLYTGTYIASNVEYTFTQICSILTECEARVALSSKINRTNKESRKIESDALKISSFAKLTLKKRL
jgi:hypothetical protein